MQDIETLSAAVAGEIARNEHALAKLEELAESLPDVVAPLTDEMREALERFEALCSGDLAPVAPLPNFGIRI